MVINGKEMGKKICKNYGKGGWSGFNDGLKNVEKDKVEG